MKKIYLSPSDQTANAYAYGGTNEAAQCRRFADAAQAALERCGFAVKNNQSGSMYDRAAESNRWEADLHVCIHTNAFDGTVSGTRMFAFNTTGSGYKAAQAIFRVLAPITPGRSENLTARPGLYEIRVTNAPCVYIFTTTSRQLSGSSRTRRKSVRPFARASAIITKCRISRPRRMKCLSGRKNREFLTLRTRPRP